MSDLLKLEFDRRSAISFNKTYGPRLGWYRNIPPAAILKFPNLALDPVEGSDEDKGLFASAVYRMQRAHFKDPDSADGKMGTGTRKVLYSIYAPVADDARYYLHYGIRLEAPARDNHSRVVTYKDADGIDMHRSGKSDRKHPIKGIMLHWSGTLTVESCYRVLMNRKLSSHFGVGQDVIYQWMDTEFQAWHGGSANRSYIGIDICSTPTVKYKEKLEKYGHEVHVKENKTGRGDKKVLTLDPKIARATRELILDLCSVHNIPLRVPRGVDGWAESGDYWHGVFDQSVIEGGEFEGIICHDNATPKKKDCACWVDEIFDPLFA